MGNKNKPAFNKWALVSFVIGALFGSGALWQWKDVQLKEQAQHIETVQATTDLRQKIDALYSHILEITDQFVKDQNAYRLSPLPELNNHMIHLKSQLDLAKDDFLSLEKKLAAIEGRSPRNIPIDLVPPEPPTGLHIVQ